MIFLHSSFRTSSTWLFAHFRKSDALLSFYEIFNEELATLSSRKATIHGPQDWNSKHPPCAPYFLEFLPFIRREGGVEGFDRSMSFDSFVPASGIAGELSDQEKLYVGKLIEHGAALTKTPFLCCTRSLGRVNAIKAAFQGTHILIYRSLLQQWCSYCEQEASGNAYFQMAVSKAIEANLHDPFFRYLHAQYPLGVAPAQAFDRFVLFHLYLYGQVAEACDIIVDANKVANDKRYRRKVEAEIAAHCDVTLDLGDAHSSAAYSFANFGSSAEFSRRLARLLTIVLDETFSRKGREFVVQAVSDVIDEYRKHHALGFLRRGVRPSSAAAVALQQPLLASQD